ncbi:MAG: hypothetical protein ACR2K1_14460 [Saprospiraceae bacterium]
MKNKGLLALIGFLLFVFGFTAIVLQMVGVSWYFLSFLELPGRLFAFVAKVLMLLFGVVIIVLAYTDWDLELRDSSEP